MKGISAFAVTLAAACLVVVTLGGCSRGISYSQKELDLPKCADRSAVKVEDIRADDCNPWEGL